MFPFFVLIYRTTKYKYPYKMSVLPTNCLLHLMANQKRHGQQNIQILIYLLFGQLVDNYPLICVDRSPREEAQEAQGTGHMRAAITQFSLEMAKSTYFLPYAHEYPVGAVSLVGNPLLQRRPLEASGLRRCPQPQCRCRIDRHPATSRRSRRHRPVGAVLDDRIAVVTGAGSGMGRTFSIALAQAGADVVITELPGKETAAGETAAEVRAAGRRPPAGFRA